MIAYASQILSKSERYYDAHKLGVLSPEVVTYREISYVPVWWKFEVYMDNNPLTYILTTA